MPLLIFISNSVYSGGLILSIKKSTPNKSSSFVVESHKDTVFCNVFRFYLSNFFYWKNGVKTPVAGPRAVLLSLDKIEDLHLPYRVDAESDSLQFTLGVDSIANVSGAMTGDLDPDKGMYWAWHSGYINLKVEGRTGHCGNIEWHLGGYQYPFANAQTCVVPFNKGVICVRPEILFAAWKEGVPMQEMKPSVHAVTIMKYWKKAFGICEK